MIKARFIGKNGSMGFIHDMDYWIEITQASHSPYWIWVRELNTGRKCPYANMKKLRENWSIKNLKVIFGQFGSE
jgi:hypothetical protein